MTYCKVGRTSQHRADTARARDGIHPRRKSRLRGTPARDPSARGPAKRASVRFHLASNPRLQTSESALRPERECPLVMAKPPRLDFELPLPRKDLGPTLVESRPTLRTSVISELPISSELDQLPETGRLVSPFAPGRGDACGAHSNTRRPPHSGHHAPRPQPGGRERQPARVTNAGTQTPHKHKSLLRSFDPLANFSLALPCCHHVSVPIGQAVTRKYAEFSFTNTTQTHASVSDS